MIEPLNLKADYPPDRTFHIPDALLTLEAKLNEAINEALGDVLNLLEGEE